MPAIIISGKAGAKVAKFCIQAKYISDVSLGMTNCPLMGVVRVT